MGRHDLECRDDSVAHGGRVMVSSGQVCEQGAAGGALHEGDDRGPVGRTHDEVALPVAGLDTIEHRSGPVVDQRHAGDRARASSLGVPARQAMTAPETQDPSRQLTGQAPEIRTVHGLVDRLGAEPALPSVGILLAQPARDLLGTPARLELAGHPRAQLGIEGEPARPMQSSPRMRTPLRLERPIATARVGAAGELAADGGRRPAHEGGDLAHRASLTAEVGQADALVLGQVPR